MSNATGPAWDTTMAAVDGQRRQSVVASQRMRVPSISDKYMTSYTPRNHNLRLGVVRCPAFLGRRDFLRWPPQDIRAVRFGLDRLVNRMDEANRSTEFCNQIDQRKSINKNRQTKSINWNQSIKYNQGKSINEIRSTNSINGFDGLNH